MAELTPLYDLIVIGAGPAGAAAASTAARRGARVLLLERGRYPRHKVCGEFVSPESLGLLALLLPDSRLLERAPRVHGARLFLDGRVFAAPLAPPAASITRFDLDAALWCAALSSGAECRQQTTADMVQRAGAHFVVMTSGSPLTTRAIIDASGRWSNLNRSPGPNAGWLGLKAHFTSDAPQPTTDLYFFNGGYCGVQPVGDRCVNVCAMVRAQIASTLPEVLVRHPRLAEASRSWRPTMAPVATSPLVFRRPTPDRDGLLCAGDAAGFIDPFAGDGIALALRTGAAAAESLCEAEWDIPQAVLRYRRLYTRQFAPALRAAARLRRLLALPALLRAPFLPLLNVSWISAFVVRRTRAA